MGQTTSTTCTGCGHRFDVDVGGGFTFHLLRCDTCGTPHSISFEEVGEPHLRYLKGLPGPYAVVTMEHDKHVKDTYPGEPLTEEDYEREVEGIAGHCQCGGRYLFGAPPRCPSCGSAELQEDPGGHMVFYD